MVEAIFFNPWIWILGAITGVLTILAIVGIPLWRKGVAKRETRYDEDGFGWLIVSVFSGVVATILSGVYFAGVLVPYDTDFYKTYRVTGELTSLENAFSGDEGTMSQVFVAEVEGVDHLIKSEDQRFRTLEVGDDVNLVCSLEFRYFQEPWYDCSFGGAR